MTTVTKAEAKNKTDSKNKIDVTEHLGLAHMCAARFKNRGVEYEELYSAACLGLLKARDGFDDSFGVKFSTYAVPVIMGEIKRVFRDGGTIKTSRSIKELSLKITRIREDFLLRFGREPDIDELCAETGEREEKIIEAQNASLPPISLTVGDEETDELDIAVSATDVKLLDILSLRQILKKLPSDEKKLLYLRYFKGLTQSQTAKILKTTQVQISRREKKLLSKLREELI